VDFASYFILGFRTLGLVFWSIFEAFFLDFSFFCGFLTYALISWFSSF